MNSPILTIENFASLIIINIYLEVVGVLKQPKREDLQHLSVAERVNHLGKLTGVFKESRLLKAN